MSPRQNLAVVESAEPTQVIRTTGEFPMPDHSALGEDTRIGRVLADSYRITRSLASGGMGTVYEATHVRLQQKFSIKFLDHQLARNAEAYARFRQEAEIAASLDHDSIVQVYDFNTDTDGNPYIVMEYVDGVTLDAWMHDRRATPREVLRLFEPLCSALAAAHAAGIVHRDLKPTNVMVRGQGAGENAARVGVKLLDFGISKMRTAGDGMTRTHVVMGTPNYMSPEQASGNASSVDATTDIFALGAILYELFAGRRAFEGGSTPALLHAIVYEQPTPLGTLCPDLPPAALAVVEKCLAKDPAQRFVDTPSLMVALRAALRVPSARRTVDVAPIEPAPAPAPSRGIGLGLAVGWVASVAASAVTAVWLLGRSASVTPEAPQPAALVEAPAPAPEPVAELGFRDALATPGAFVLESGSQLYRADPRGISYWSDPDAETVMRPLPSSAHVTAIGRAREGDVLVGQADGTVTRWDRELREVPWQDRIGTAPITSVAGAAGYLALAIGSEVHLVHAESGKALKRFTDGRAVALLFTRHPTESLVIVRDSSVEVIDADKRKSLGVAPLSGHALRAEVAAEPIDGAAEIEIDFVQGDWIVRRRFRVHTSRRGQAPRLEPVSQTRL